MKLIPSAHFKRRLLERGVTWKDCEETVASPDRKSSQYKGVNGGVVHKYEKDLPIGQLWLSLEKNSQKATMFLQ